MKKRDYKRTVLGILRKYGPDKGAEVVSREINKAGRARSIKKKRRDKMSRKSRKLNRGK